MDVQGWRKWAKPFAIYGMNAIAVFMLAGVLGRILPAIKVTNAAGKKVGLQTYLYENLCAPFASPDTAPFFGFLASPKNASLMWALMYVDRRSTWSPTCMYRRKWFLKFWAIRTARRGASPVAVTLRGLARQAVWLAEKRLASGW